MARRRIKWNPEGLYDVRRDPALIDLEEDLAQEIADRAMDMGKGTYVVGSTQGEKRPQGRWRTSVVAADAKAIAHDRKHNTLLRALGGG